MILYLLIGGVLNHNSWNVPLIIDQLIKFYIEYIK